MAAPKSMLEQLRHSILSLDPEHIDKLYGLEPVYEPVPDHRRSALRAVGAVQCPHCWQHYEVAIDLTAGDSCYIEDCQVCCQPLEFVIELDADGALASINARRLDQ
ncbi:MAG: CPXCG motif-containing cysteine-rich protein [Steroidobacteraceae bacterium]